MGELVVNFGLWWSPVILVILLISVTRLGKINITWLAGAVIIFAIYVLSNKLGGEFFSLGTLFPDARFNWGGKLAEIVAVLLMALFIGRVARSTDFKDHGFTLTQAKGSMVPAFLMTVVLVGTMVALTFAFSGPSDAYTSQIIETLAFQSTLPGLSEEPMFRGLLLMALSLAVVSRGINILGAKIGWGGLLVTMLFVLGHSVFWTESGLQVSADAMIVTGYLGFGLLWIRERTGSIVMPIIAHNLINVASNLVEFMI